MTTWQFQPEFDSAALRELLAGDGWRQRAVPVKRNARRAVWRIPPANGRPGLYVKEDFPGSLRNRVKNLWRWKCAAELAAGLALRAAGVPVVRFVAWGKAPPDSLLVSEEFTGAEELGELLARTWHEPAARARLLPFLAGFLNRLLRAGVVHWDLHPGNILVRPLPLAEPPFYEGVLADVYGVRTGRPFNPRLVATTLGLLKNRLPWLPPAERSAFLDATFAGTPAAAAPAAWLAACEAAWRRQRLRDWPGRRASLLAHGAGLATRFTDAQGRWLIRAGLVAPATAQTLLANASAGQGTILKTGKAGGVRRLSLEGHSYIAKEYHVGWRFGWWRRDRQCWLNCARLEKLVPAAHALAWLRARDGHGWILLADVGPLSLHRWFKEPAARPNDGTTAETLLDDLATFLAALHRRGIFHPDLKPTNLHLQPPEPELPTPFRLIDCDRVHFRRPLSRQLRSRNLRQILDGLARWLTPEQRRRFLAAYLAQLGHAADPQASAASLEEG
ncbi:MAG: serine/threonine-protein kinase [Lentisphaeria bacterium]|jgi:tRNA A-37 threonylcarbamoyl transferase component Bud32